MEKQSSMGDQFLTKINRIINDRLEDEHFSVEDLAREVGLSRSVLYRKLMRLMGKTPTDLITETRLARAKELLENDVATAAEIAYKVGFNSPSYFNNVFKKHYKVTPGDIRKHAATNFSKLKEDKQNYIQELNRLRNRHWWIYASIFLVVVLLAVGSIFYLPKEKISLEKSIAVLPFRNDSPEPDNEYLCNGMVDEIITNLQKIRDIKVKSRTSTETYRNSDKDITQIAKELEVEYILEGSVRKSGENLRIYVHLIDGKTGDDLWAENYDGKYTDEIFTFQSDIAIRIASA
jgi:TolB-like protein/AraC-like DNA-binding protein